MQMLPFFDLSLSDIDMAACSRSLNFFISNSFFISVSDINDEKLSKDGYSITISTHSKAIFWEGLTKDEYETKIAS